MNDWKLLDEYRQRGSASAFAELVQRHTGRVYAVALGILKDPHAAEDAVQSTFLTLWHKAGELPRRTVLAGWLCLTARHMAWHQRKKDRRRRHYERLAGGDRLNRRRVPFGEEALKNGLKESLAGLTPPQRQVLLLRELYGRPEAEVARELGVSRGVVSVRLSRARRRLLATAS